MSTVIINIKTDPNVKAQAQKIAADFGLSLSGILNAYLRDLIRNKKINFSLDQEKEEIPTKYMLDSIREAEEEIKKGEVSPSFSDAKSAIAWLNNPNRKYENQI